MQGYRFVLPFLACCSVACRAEQSLQARFESSLQAAKSISNVEIEWLDIYTLNDPIALESLKVKAFSRTFQYSIAASGTKFRAVCRLLSGTQTNLSRLKESAFDGDTWASYWDDYHKMVKGRSLPPGDNSESAHNPLVAPFMFLTKFGVGRPNNVLRFSDITAGQLTRGLSLPSPTKLHGLIEVSIPALSAGTNGVTWQIALDEAGDSFAPRRITLIAPGSRGYRTVYNFFEYTNLAAYRFPSRTEWVMTSYPPTTPPTVLASGSDTVISARMPDLIADSVFRLDDEEKSAKIVWDNNSAKLVRMAPELADIKKANRTVKVALWLMILSTTMVFLFAGAKTCFRKLVKWAARCL